MPRIAACPKRTASVNSAPVLSVKDVSVALPASGERAYAVRNISLDVYPGETLCIVGESGSGKSVTAYAVMRLLPKMMRLESGAIFFHGRNLLNLSMADVRALRGNDLSMIFQEPMTALNPSFTIGNQLREMYSRRQKLGGRKGLTRRAGSILQLLEMVRLPDPARLLGAYPHQLSGGQRQRVMIAMAMALQPALLIADEPTTSLDVTTQARILDIFRDLRENNDTAIIFVTHDFGVVAEIAERIVVMEKGAIVETGTARRVLNTPSHAYTQKLIAAIPRMKTEKKALAAGAGTVLKAAGIGKTFYTRRGLTRRARAVAAVKDVSFHLKKSEALAIVGESGSGKTTLARCLMRLIEADAGTLEINGVDFMALRGDSLVRHRRAIQIVFQDPYSSLNPRKTIRDTLLQGPVNFGVPGPQALARARQLLRTVRLDENALNRYPNQFSGGQRQRICIARALMLSPDILVADEAVSALDVSVQSEVLKLLDDIRNRMGLTLLFVTHDLRVASRVCDRVLVMKDGGVVEHGPVSEVFNAPQHPYTQTLLAAIPGRHWRSLS